MATTDAAADTPPVDCLRRTQRRRGRTHTDPGSRGDSRPRRPHERKTDASEHREEKRRRGNEGRPALKKVPAEAAIKRFTYARVRDSRTVNTDERCAGVGNDVSIHCRESRAEYKGDIQHGIIIYLPPSDCNHLHTEHAY